MQDFVAATLFASAALTTNLYVSALVGVPVIFPVDLLMLKPSGSFPESMLQVYGLVPPEALSVHAIEAPRATVEGIVPVIVVLVTLRVNVLEEDPAEFLAVALTVNVPDSVGFPVIFPVLEHESPPGSPVTVHVIVGVPEASSCLEYDAPTMPVGRLVVVIVGATTAEAMTTVKSFVAVLPLASLTLSRKLYVFATVGVPLRYSEFPDLLMRRPGGIVPLSFVHV